MKTYKNSDIAKKYKVSLPTVNRWIENALEGKNNLKLESVDAKYRIIENSHNDSVMSQLYEQGLIYRNKTSFAEISPTDEFYAIFTPEQQREIAYNLKNRREIPLKYTYINGGATIWQTISDNAQKSGSGKAFQVTPQLLKMLKEYLIFKSEGKKYNIIDLGPGDAANTKVILEYLVEASLLNHYVAIDISKEMLGITKENIGYISEKVHYDEIVLDFENNDLGNVSRKIKTEKTINLILLIGNTLGNVQDEIKIFKNLEYGLNNDDLVVFSNRLDGYNELTNWGHLTSVNERHLFIPQMLGIDTKESKFVLQYSEHKRSRTACLVLDKDYSIKIDSDIINLHKDDEIMVWHHKMTSKQDISSILQLCHLEQTAYLTSPDLSHYICVCTK